MRKPRADYPELLAFRLEQKAAKQIRTAAKRDGRSVSEWLRDASRRALEVQRPASSP